MRRYLYLFIIALSCIVRQTATAQTTIRNYDIKNGMPDNSVNCIAQDGSGFVWIGTSNGLSRFDGMFFTVFRHENNDSSTIANNNIHAIYTCQKGVYFSTDKGIDFYDYQDNKFHHCTLNGQTIGKRVLNIEATSRGLFATDENGKLLSINGTVLKHIQRNLKVYGITAVDGQKGQGVNLFAVCDEKVVLLTADASRWVSILHTPLIGKTSTKAYFSRNQRKVFVGNGIGTRSYAFETTGEKIKPIADNVPADLRAITDYEGGTAFATDGHGVMVRNGNGDRWLNEDNDGICGDAVYSLFADRTGNLWIGSYREGLTQYNHNRFFFNCINEFTHTLPFDLVTAVASCQGNVFVGMDGGGMGIYSMAAKRMTNVYTSANSALWGDNVVAMDTDGKDVWMAVYNKGLTAFNIASQRFTNHTLPVFSNVGDIIWTLCDSHDGNLWVGGRDILVFNKATRKFLPVRQLTGCGVQAFSCRGRYMWMGCSKGVYKIDKTTHRILKHYDTSTEGMALPNNSVRYIYADSKGRVWVSFSYDDICCIDEHEGKVRTYDMQQGLGSNTVTGIVESRYGYMMFSTTNGMYFFFPNNDTFMRCDLDNKIPLSYNYGACHTNGQNLFFGSTEGLVWAADLPMQPNSLFKRVSFNALSVANGRTVNLGGNGCEELTLDNDENYFTVHFSVPEYTAPRSLRFSYYLKGMEEGWKDMTDSRQAQYTNVPPGTYEFIVRCTDLTGRWTRPSVLHITVLPPWYLTWWAKTLWTLIIIGLVYAAVKIYLRELYLHHKMELAEVEKESQRKVDEAKMSFFTSITHELRTPVFLIAAQLEELIDRRQSMISVPSTYLMAMHRSATKINKLISRAIDFRKMDEGKLALQKQTINITSFVRDLADDYVELCDQKDITFSVSLPDHPVRISVDGEKIEMCINNLVSNAYKYTREKGHVILTLSDFPDRVMFSVKDDGIGIVPKAREEIFKSFYRTERGQAQSKGDGIGLGFVQKLVELHGGKMSLESEVNVGSTFSFFIPKALDKNKEAMEAATTCTPVNEPCQNADNTTKEATNVFVKENKPKDCTLKSVEKAPVKSNPTATHTLLLIDDERETVELLERNLVNDFHVLKAYDGVEGLKVARERLPDLIVCDMMMPNLDGIGFLQTMKNDKKMQHIKVIIFTGQTSEEERIAAYDAGADAYITKPVSLKLLRTRIDRLIAESDNAALTASLATDKRSYNKEEQIFLLRCREIIDDNLGNPDFSVDFLAEKLAMSHSALYKKLKQMTGMSLIEFVNDYKIYKAVQCFKEGQTNVERVAEQCGFGDVKNFRTLFKRKMQVTPKQFVQSL